mmetsp:Transcript_10301/g.30374  ORF Transcript_10301/g.30374 Transcript_10301/m.30374 type:complete len:213 (-) Transcript_10301:1215-1853(-)
MRPSPFPSLFYVVISALSLPPFRALNRSPSSACVPEEYVGFVRKSLHFSRTSGDLARRRLGTPSTPIGRTSRFRRSELANFVSLSSSALSSFSMAQPSSLAFVGVSVDTVTAVATRHLLRYMRSDCPPVTVAFCSLLRSRDYVLSHFTICTEWVTKSPFQPNYCCANLFSISGCINGDFLRSVSTRDNCNPRRWSVQNHERPVTSMAVILKL